MIGNLDHKYKELDHLLSDCIENYHNPERFFTYSHSLIQACRNLTFAIQANKKSIPDFDTWYTSWQDTMKADPFMKWLHDNRTKVVHDDVIASRSYAKLTTLPDYTFTTVEEYFNYKTNNEQIADKAIKLAVEKPDLAHSVMQVERAYLVDVAGKPYEAVHVLAHVFYFLGMLLSDLEIYLGGQKGYQGPPLDLSEYIETRIGNDIVDQYRFYKFKVRTGEPLNDRVITVKRDKEVIEAATERYGSENIPKISKMNVEDAAKSLLNVAKVMLQKDGSYLAMAFIHTTKGYMPTAVVFRDRAEKILFSHQFAAQVERLNGDAVIFISEAWMHNDVKKGLKRLREGKEIKGMRNKQEGLSLMMLTKDLRSLGITVEFTKTDTGIVFGEELIDRPKPLEMAFLMPVYNLWSKNKRPDIDSSPTDKESSDRGRSSVL